MLNLRDFHEGCRGRPPSPEPKCAGVIIEHNAQPVAVLCPAVQKLDWSECAHVEIDPLRVSGHPAVKGAMMPVDDILPTTNMEPFNAVALVLVSASALEAPGAWAVRAAGSCPQALSKTR